MSFDDLRRRILSWLSSPEQARFQTCLRMWKGDDGCRAIQTRCHGLDMRLTRYPVQAVDAAIRDLDEIFDEFIRRGWVLDVPLTLYRGVRLLGQAQQGYVACSFDPEEAEAYGSLTMIKVPAGVPWIPFDTEREILLRVRPSSYLYYCDGTKQTETDSKGMACCSSPSSLANSWCSCEPIKIQSQKQQTQETSATKRHKRLTTNQKRLAEEIVGLSKEKVLSRVSM